ncbi:urease subunit beta, partial [Klebsiella pneumoniae]
MVKKVETGVSVGGYVLADSPITFNEGRSITTVHVKNTGDRPIQVGSHFHFFEANKALEFERSKAFGKRLNITATTAIRFEPGDAIT